jgi:hypothetical protein
LRSEAKHADDTDSAQNRDMIELAYWVAGALGAYLAAGAVFAVVLTLVPGDRALRQLDPGANGMPLSARLLILPGIALLWPLMLMKWRRRSAPPEA